MNKNELEQNLLLIANEANKALNFTRQILELVLLEQPEKQFHFDNVDVVGIVDSAIKNNELYAKTNGIKMNFIKIGMKFIANVAESNLINAYSNIINNAIKYSDENNEINVSLKKDRSDIIFEVKDFGYGIPKDEIPRIFDKHVRGKHAKDNKKEGIGIGLTITKIIIEKHLGNIYVDSDLGKGSTFTIRIPKVKENNHGKKSVISRR
jgi:signal transduction histidine kinase